MTGGQRTTIRIDALAPGGEGLARRDDGRVVFVEATAPGDLVEIRSEEPETRAGALRAGRPLAVMEAGPDRIEPVCPLAARCGGCDWMHLGESAQIAWHARIVSEVVAHATGQTDAIDISTHPARAALGYRTRVRLHASARGGRATVGFRAAHSREIVPVTRCAVTEPRLMEALSELVGALQGARGEGELTLAFGGEAARSPRLVVIDATWDGELPQRLWSVLDAWSREGSMFAGARVTMAGAVKPAVFGDPRPVQLGFDGRPVVICAGGFAQPSDAGAALLAERVSAFARPKEAYVLELFSGSGTLSIALAAGAKKFVSVELDDAAVICARENFAARGLTGKLGVGDAERVTIAGRPDVVVLDPPRAGAKGACAAIAKARPRRIVYVSCEPTTLARDLGTLARSGYRVTALETIELFSQTSHVETIALLEPARAAAGSS